MNIQSSETLKLPIINANLENIAPYGQLLGPDSNVSANMSDFYEGAVSVTSPVDFKSDSETCLSLAKIQPRPFEITYLERHFKHTQTFIPLSGKPFIAVLGKPNNKELPEIDKLKAFRFDGNSGFTMHIGTWHEFPFAIEKDTNVVVILRDETTKNLSSDNVIDGEAHGGDLDKKNILRRTGKLIVLDI
ncbi:MAG: ureidoglycolate lyase [Pseudomonadota bacterium]|nr:ureidoglycolate lyase [Pseudomonadota bacterium]